MKVIVLGATGMLGHAMVATLAQNPSHDVIGTVRSTASLARLNTRLRDYCKALVDVDNPDQLTALFATYHPDVVINCIGLVKQLSESNDPLSALPTNALLPHRLARLCAVAEARLIHVSTDCVFSGLTGGYVESDIPDACDLYGRSKLLGEVDYPNAITLRTSIIGHELSTSHGLIEWFLAQEDVVQGFSRAVFSGLPTCELAKVVRDFVLPNTSLRGVYHVSSEPISKYELLQLVNHEYGKGLKIESNERLQIDRSLNSLRFQQATGYKAPSWAEMISSMRAFNKGF